MAVLQKIIFIVLVATVIVVVGFLVWKWRTQAAPVLPIQPENKDEADLKRIRVEILQEGSGDAVQKGDLAAVHYVGFFPDGTKFDSSVDRGEAFTFQVGAGQVIRGWDLGVVGMKQGEARRLTIPSDLAYGKAGAGNGKIPPDAILLFNIQLLSFRKP